MANRWGKMQKGTDFIFLGSKITAYLRLLIFLPEILMPACDSSSLAFCMRYCSYNLNKQDDNIQFLHTPFPIWNQYVVPHPVITVASWPACSFLRKQVRGSIIPISVRIFPQFVVIHTFKGFSIVNEAEVDIFLVCSCFFYDPIDVGNLISGSSVFSKSSWTSGNSWLKNSTKATVED